MYPFSDMIKGDARVSSIDPHLPIARKLKHVESVRVELLQQVTEVFRAVQGGENRDLSQALGGLIGVSYYLASLMDIPFEQVDRAVSQGFAHALSEADIDTRTYESILRHVGVKR